MIPKIIFSDFDGTLSHHTELTTEFFKILDLVKEHKIPLVIVTGRSISWGHFLLTHFADLKHVICEGGGIYCGRRSGNILYNELYIGEKEVSKLESFSKNLLKKFYGLELSADSLGRVTDRAVELDILNEDLERKKEIKAYMDKEGINYSQSNVHLNYWCGEISKYRAVQEYTKKFFPDVSLEECLYFGDSLNDESMFKSFKHSVGVSNIKDVLKQLEYEPSEVLIGKENEGPFGVLNYLEKLLK